MPTVPEKELSDYREWAQLNDRKSPDDRKWVHEGDWADYLNRVLPNGDMTDQVVSYDYLISKGYNHHVAEALVGREITYNQLKYKSAQEVFTEFLEWNGIIGFTGMIVNALDNCRNVEAL